ncbi:MAG: hypothetical protein ACLPPF_17355 [Rhodomicrobium sp.]
MKSILLAMSGAIFAIAASVSCASAAGRCAAYGSEETDFTWRLCPGGEKYERRYLYYGFWSDFYRVSAGTGACDWLAAQSSWICPRRTIRCDADKCGPLR